MEDKIIRHYTLQKLFLTVASIKTKQNYYTHTITILYMIFIQIYPSWSSTSSYKRRFARRKRGMFIRISPPGLCIAIWRLHRHLIKFARLLESTRLSRFYSNGLDSIDSNELDSFEPSRLDLFESNKIDSLASSERNSIECNGVTSIQSSALYSFHSYELNRFE